MHNKKINHSVYYFVIISNTIIIIIIIIIVCVYTVYEEVGIGIISPKLYLFHCFSLGYHVGFMSFRLRPVFTTVQLVCKLELTVLNCRLL